MGIKYNEESKLIDILNQPKYKVLKEDKQYNEYIEDYINTWDKITLATKECSKFYADEELSKDEEASIGDFFGLIGSATSTGIHLMASSNIDDLNEIEKKIYSQYSKSKIQLAKNFKQELKTKIYKALEISSASVEYKLKPKHHQINYWSINKYIKEDTSLKNKITNIAEDMDEFIMKSYLFRRQLNTSYFCGFETQTDSIYNYSSKIMEKQLTLNKTYYSKADDYFNLLNKVTKNSLSINKDILENKNLWSKEKIESINFILNDIVKRTNLEVTITSQILTPNIVTKVNNFKF